MFGEAKRPSRWALVLLCAAVVGCDIGGDDNSGIAVPRPPGEAAIQSRGKELFSNRCGGCHTLSAAGTEGTRGSNFDRREVDYEEALFAIRNGGFSGEVMPAQIVSGDDAVAVAEFLAEASGSKAGE